MYYCELCDYKTENRSYIEEHHIIPKELGGSNKKSNLIKVCGQCHSKIYIPESKSGLHSIKTNQSIIINGWFQSTNGLILSIKLNNIDQYINKKNIN